MHDDHDSNSKSDTDIDQDAIAREGLTIPNAAFNFISPVSGHRWCGRIRR